MANMDLFELSETSINKRKGAKPEWAVPTLPIMIKDKPSTESQDRTAESQLHHLEYPTTDSVFTPGTLSGIKQETPEHNDTTITVGFTQRLIPVQNIQSNDFLACAPVKSERISTEEIGISNTNGITFTETHYESLRQDGNIQPYPVILYRRQGNSVVNVAMVGEGQTDLGNDSSSRKSDMANKMRTQTAKKPYVCLVCDHGYTCRSALVRHIRTHTEEKPYKCSLCGNQFGQSSHLSSHMTTHTGEKQFGCLTCEYRCTKKSALVRHTRTHTGEKPYKCSVCIYKCSDRSKLSLHMRTHTGEKPYKCSVCGYKCSARSNFCHHMRTHTGEKPFGCSMCDYRCTKRSDLSRHTRKHTGERPYGCSMCDFKCTKKCYLARHMLTHTG